MIRSAETSRGQSTLTRVFLACGVVALCGTTCRSLARGEDVARVFRAGACAADITPLEFPISSNGGMTDRQMTSAHDPLHARCLVLDNGERALVIVIVDSCMIPRDIFDDAKRRIEASTGIPASHQLMAATHTHTAVSVSGVFQSEPEEAYRRFVVDRIVEGVETAHGRREAARIGWGVGNDPSQVFNRRWFTREGVVNPDPFDQTTDRVRMNPGFDASVKREPSGPVDPEVCFLSVQSNQGRPIALLANYSLHYVGGVPGGALSADYFGEYARRIAERIKAIETDPPFVGIMSNGTSGNINNVDYSAASARRSEPFEQIQLVAASVAEATLAALKNVEYRDWVPLEVRQKEIELGVRLPSDGDVQVARQILAEAGPGPYKDRRQIYAHETIRLALYPKKVKVLLQALRIGDVGIASSPCETFVETGLAIKAESLLRPSFTIELANGYNGYLPTPEHHDLGGYETWRARSSYLDRDAEPILRATLLSLLGDVATAE